MKRIFRKPYSYWVLGIFIVYLLLLILISGFYNTIPLIIVYAETLNWFKLSLSIGLSLLIAFLVSITGVLSYIKYRERKQCKEGATLAGVGTAGGLIAGVCPLCVTGILPVIFGFFGASFTFASLPFQGVEIQVIAAIILLISLWILNKGGK